MAEAVASGAQKVPGVTVKLITVADATLNDVSAAQAIIIGSPVYNANVSPEIQTFINSWPHNGMQNKIGAAFVSAGGISAGQESTLLSMLRSMLIFRMIVLGGASWQAPFGAAAIVGEAPFESSALTVAPQFLDQATDLGQRVAEIVSKIKLQQQ